MVKRTIDVLSAGSALVLLSPLLLLLALLLRVVEGKPVFYVQERVGRGGGTFEILKFRSMRAGSPGPLFTGEDDPRITRVGAILRKTKLDEIPQLWNVLRGSMSLVGPRPEVPYYVAKWPTASRRISLSVRPGITDPASWLLIDEGALLANQARPNTYYEEVLIPFKCCMYVKYAETATTATDMAILFGTLARLMGLHAVSNKARQRIIERLGAESCIHEFEKRS
ncbi:sugar transferase [Janibacter cremeus]|uniref:sugar transferase n=1 Tax=Janibacter cremeus TaxID=1285192 RepID=UPI0023F6D274|nr:sugar transferase [Janibacter cremeus]WEV78215.1 sugar transferase [Janibacter cremeus]WEV78295.1 sugar transferase [Janibacter cremeus]